MKILKTESKSKIELNIKFESKSKIELNIKFERGE